MSGDGSSAAWRPTASPTLLRQRARLLQQIREYFADTGVLEVDTPLLYPYGTSEPTLTNFVVAGVTGLDDRSPHRYLQTSPEFAMKRLLAAGVGDIYQICKAFRREERGTWHHEEFTLLEWYRIGFDHHALMDDVEALLRRLLPGLPYTRSSYASLGLQHASIDPLSATTDELVGVAETAGVRLDTVDRSDRGLLLDILFSHSILPRLKTAGAVFVFDFPCEHAAYARIREGGPAVAERFELIINGLEVANGYHEVIDAAEQRRRHTGENERRRQRGLPIVALDERLLAAMDHGLPECAGVALGIDRLVMLATAAKTLASTLSFGHD